MRKTYALIAVAGSLLADPEGRHWGYALSRASGIRSGSMYPVLARMLEAGWLRDGWEPQPKGRPPRRYYEVTTEGRSAMEVVVAGEMARLGRHAPRGEAGARPSQVPRRRKSAPPVVLKPPCCPHQGTRVIGGWCVPCQRTVLPGGLYADQDE